MFIRVSWSHCAVDLRPVYAGTRTAAATLSVFACVVFGVGRRCSRDATDASSSTECPSALCGSCVLRYPQRVTGCRNRHNAVVLWGAAALDRSHGRFSAFFLRYNIIIIILSTCIRVRLLFCSSKKYCFFFHFRTLVTRRLAFFFKS